MWRKKKKQNQETTDEYTALKQNTTQETQTAQTTQLPVPLYFHYINIMQHHDIVGTVFKIFAVFHHRPRFIKTFVTKIIHVTPPFH